MTSITTTTATASIEALAKNQTILLNMDSEKHLILAKPLFNALQQHFPDASFEVLKTLLKNNTAYGLHIAQEHRLIPMLTQ